MSDAGIALLMQTIDNQERLIARQREQIEHLERVLEVVEEDDV